MNLQEKFMLWQFDELKKINNKTELVINKYTNQLMIKKEMHECEYEIHYELCSVRHENLLTIYDVVSDSGICTVLEEYINGITLEQYCKGRKLDDMQIVDIIIQLCRGLSILHEKNIIHRDITPTNIMIDNYGTVKIIDFDISRMTNSTSSHDTHILGTQGYAAPEQYGFMQSGPQTDIYAVGAIINFMKKGTTLDEAQLDDGSGLADIMRKCIEFEPERRYENIGLLIADLESYRTAPDKRVALGGRKKEFFLRTLIIELPGVCSKNYFIKVFAITCYIIGLLYMYSVLSNIGNNAKFNQGVVILIFVLIVPFLCFSNYLSFQNKVFKSYSFPSKRSIFKLLGVISLIGGAYLSTAIIK